MQNLNYNNYVAEPIVIEPINITITEQSSQDKRKEAEKWLLDTLADSRRIADEQGWISQEEIEREFSEPITISEQNSQDKRKEAEKWLLDTLANSRRIADEQGWLTEEEVDRRLDLI